MRLRDIRWLQYGWLIALVLFASGNICASTIDTFSFTAAPSPFSTNLTESFTSTMATLSGTIACDSTTTCSGELGTFNVGVDVTNLTALDLTSQGSLAGGTSAGSGTVNLSSPFQNIRSFYVPFGNFDRTRVSGEFPAFGMTDVSGVVDLTLQPGQTITLNHTVTLDSVAPEPRGEVFLLLAAALGLAGFVRSRYSQPASEPR